MKDFRWRNDTNLLFRNDPVQELANQIKGRRTMFVYGGGSVHKNGCYDDVKTAVESSGGIFFEYANSSRELSAVQKGIAFVKENNIELLIGAGGASVMDSTKLIAFGSCLEGDLWEFLIGDDVPYGKPKMPMILMPTYPSSGSENGMGAVCLNTDLNEFASGFGITADVAILTPKYSLSLDAEMTAYTGLVTLTQLVASTLGDQNPVSYDSGVSVIRNVLKATKTLKEDPGNTDARGVVLCGAALSTSGRLGIGKIENYSYEIYDVETLPEILFRAPYRKSLTAILPRFLNAMAVYHEDDIKKLLKDAFDLDGDVKDSTNQLIALYTELGVDMYFDGELSEESVKVTDVTDTLSQHEIYEMMKACMR